MNRHPGRPRELALVGTQHVEERQECGGTERIESNACACRVTIRCMLEIPHDLAWQVEGVPENGRDDFEHDGEARRELDRG